MADMTLAQLQALVEQQGAELAQLKAAAAATTPAPTEYYTLAKTGEEIDEILAGSANAVRYDAAQSLTDVQKTQARGNIGAAPSGYGYGETISRIGHDNITDAEFVEMLEAKLSTMDYDSAAQVTWEDHPLFDGTIRVGTLWKSGTGEYAALTGDGYASTSLTRVKVNGVWQPFEWVNPPMDLGVEYRTTERYLGKPVYVKVVDCGLIADNKAVAHGISNMNICLSVIGVRAGFPMPNIYNHSLNDPWTCYVVAIDTTNITLACGSSSAGANCHVTLKYTKTTD